MTDASENLMLAYLRRLGAKSDQAIKAQGRIMDGGWLP